MKFKSSHTYFFIIKAVAITHIILGILLPFLAQTNIVAKLLVDEMFIGIVLSDAAQLQAAYVIALFGPTVASWGILLFVLAQSFFESPTKQKWLGLIAAVLVWYIGDSAYSLINGVTTAFLLNSFVAASLLIPLWKIRQLAFDNK
jgi:hypothetical protein